MAPSPVSPRTARAVTASGAASSGISNSCGSISESCSKPESKRREKGRAPSTTAKSPGPRSAVRPSWTTVERPRSGMLRKKTSPARRRTSAAVRSTACASEAIAATPIGPICEAPTLPAKPAPSPRESVTGTNASQTTSRQKGN